MAGTPAGTAQVGAPTLIHAALLSVATGSVAVRTALCPLQCRQCGGTVGHAPCKCPAATGERVLSANTQTALWLSPSGWVWDVTLGELYPEQQDETLGCPAGRCIVGGFVWEGEGRGERSAALWTECWCPAPSHMFNP